MLANKKSFSYNKTTLIGADRTNVWSKTVYFPNPSHDVFLVPRCRRQFSWCCSPRPMSKRIWNSLVLIYFKHVFELLCLKEVLCLAEQWYAQHLYYSNSKLLPQYWKTAAYTAYFCIQIHLGNEFLFRLHPNNYQQ